MIHKAKKSMGLNKFSAENFSPDFSFHKAKKNLGQNFLKSQEALRMMCTAGEVGNKDIILEIGPGKGALTEKLLEKAQKVIAIEKDRDLIELLSEKFAEEIKTKKLILLNEDILNLSIPETFFKFSSGPRMREDEGPDHSENLKMPQEYSLNYKLIANIPYNITGAIFKKFLSCDYQPERMILLVQKEVAERIVARDGKESILSLSVKAYGTPKYIMKVHKRFFSPAPKVDSAIIAITNISKNNFKTNFQIEPKALSEEKNFFNIIKAGFAHKRKVLRKNLESSEYLEVGLPNIDKLFEKLKIDPRTRAEDVKFEQWILISQNLSTDI
jgi:16S rRNA (adenine1518-N6/adenine1519-N6)-dimethyltransferase